MKTLKKDVRVLWVAAVAALLMSAGCAADKSKQAGAPTPDPATPSAIAPTPMPAAMTLSGANEVPANPSTATGKNMIVIGADQTVTGSIEVTGMTPTMAHIHEAAKGMNGPVIVPFVKSGENMFAPGPGAKLTDAQYASYKAGNLYINVHSAAYPGGELRLQIWPAK